jgi:hypothetical protein
VTRTATATTVPTFVTSTTTPTQRKIYMPLIMKN